MTNVHDGLNKLHPTFCNAITYLKTLSPAIYLVGGIIRNTLLGQKTTDLDLAVEGDGLPVGLLAAQHLGGTFIILDQKRGISRVIIKGSEPIQIDITSASKGIEADLADRDFTINSMAIEIDRISDDLSFARSSIIDPHNGYSDLKTGLIKSVSETSLISDPIRMMRAVRFSANSNFEISENTQQGIQDNSKLLKDVSIERVRNELLKIFDTRFTYKSLILMDQLGITEQIIPELSVTKGIKQPDSHFWDVHDHMIETVGNLEKMLQPKAKFMEARNRVFNLVPIFKGIDDYFEQRVGSGHTRLTTLKLACLLHDIGKPATRTEDTNGRIRFLDHSEVGMEIATEILERLRISKKMIALVRLEIKHHLRPSQVSPAGQLPSSKAIYRYYRDLGEVALDTIYLSMADHLSAGGPALKLEEWAAYCEVIKHLMNKGLVENSLNGSNKLLSGHDIMERLCLKPGPLIGVLLEKVEEARFEEKIKDKEEAIRFLESKIKSGE